MISAIISVSAEVIVSDEVTVRDFVTIFSNNPTSYSYLLINDSDFLITETGGKIIL